MPSKSKRQPAVASAQKSGKGLKKTSKRSGSRPTAKIQLAKKGAQRPTASLRKRPEDLLRSLPAGELAKLDNVARYRTVLKKLGVKQECASCGFIGRYVQREVVTVEPGSHYFRDKYRRLYLHLICMQCGRVEMYCPEAIGINV